MKTAGWLGLLLVAVISLGGWAQCGCGDQVEPDCYQTFKSNQTIEFSLIAPIDYFTNHQTTIAPGILGWHVRAWNGGVVRTVLFPGQPKGHWITMEWDLYDEGGQIVPAGFYEIVVMTTDGDVVYPVRVVESCRACCGCFCWWTTPATCDAPCPIPCGELYLSLDVGETRSCSGLSFSLIFNFECAEP